MSEESLNWYLISTRSNMAKKVSKNLNERGVENYLPIKMAREENTRIKVMALLNDRLFVKIKHSQFVIVKKIGGVVDFVYWLKTPVIVPEDEITIIKKFLEEYSSVKLQKTKVLSSEVTRLIHNPTITREGNILEVKHKEVIAALPTLGYNLIASIEKSTLDIISKHSEDRKTAI